MPAVEPTKGTIDPIIRKPIVTLAVFVLAAVAPIPLLFVPAVQEFVQPWLADPFVFRLFAMFAILGVMLQSVAFCILAERKLSAYMQDRVGPNRVGWLGLFQWLADGVKFFLKEDIVPKNVDKPLFLLAPAMSLIVALIGFMIIPWTGKFYFPWMSDDVNAFVQAWPVQIDIGFLYLLAVSSLGVYGIVLAGYSSNNKYSFFGGMRASAQMLSYEVPLGLGLLVILLTSGSLRLDQIIMQQAESGVWNIFLYPIPFLLILIASFAETNRMPFDLAETEQELVGGFHTEYSSMKFAMFFMAEYVHMMVGSAFLIALFLGGYAPLPFTNWLVDVGHPLPWWAGLAQFGITYGKVAIFIVFFMVIRWTIPRFRYDQLMKLAWQGLIPIGVIMVVITAVLVGLGWDRTIAAPIANGVVLVGILIYLASNPGKITGRQEHLPEITVVKQQKLSRA
jgi:NADH-quinone oxidoreductase subunit H